MVLSVYATHSQFLVLHLIRQGGKVEWVFAAFLFIIIDKSRRCPENGSIVVVGGCNINLNKHATIVERERVS